MWTGPVAFAHVDEMLIWFGPIVEHCLAGRPHWLGVSMVVVGLPEDRV
jgi:hypothetical protein